jgi:hypothetical protein
MRIYKVQRKQTQSRKLVMTLSGKGGVGKTTVARVLGEAARERDPHAVLVDGNGGVGQMLQYLGARGTDGKLLNPQPSLGGVEVFSLHGDERDRDRFLEFLTTNARTIIMDLPAESIRVLERMRDELAIFSLIEEHGFEIIMVSLLTPFRASVRDIQDALSLHPSARHVVVRNLFFGQAEDPSRNEPGDWGIWLSSKTKGQAEKLHAVSIDLPALRARIAAALDDDSLGFSSGVKSPQLSIADRQRLQVWHRSTMAAFGPAVDLIFGEPLAEAVNK